MGEHAGYASTLVAKESVLKEVLTKYHALGTIPTKLEIIESFSFSHPDIKDGEELTLTLDLDLFFQPA